MTAPRILIVDDHHDVIRLLHSALETLGHELDIVEAPSGEEAQLEATRGRIDLLVVDYHLPGISGVELMEKIRAHCPDVKMILVTGMTDKKTREEMRNSGAVATFDKPIPLADFLDVVERSLGLTRTILPPEASEAADAQRQTLAELITNFRKEIQAQAVFLLSDRGRVQVRAGDLPDSSLEVSLLSALMAIYSAGQKISRFIHQDVPASFHIFRGGDQDLIMLPVSASHALFVAGNHIADRDRLIKTMDTLLALRNDVEKGLRLMGVAPSVVVAEREVPREEVIEKEALSSELTNLLVQSKKRKLKPEEVDSFWEKAVEMGVILTDPSTISYDQARQLGLTPDEVKK